MNQMIDDNGNVWETFMAGESANIVKKEAGE